MSTARADAVARLAAEPATSGLFSDYDGSISEIVGDPSLAIPVPGVLDALHDLAGSLRVVAVISGRPARFLADHLDIASRRSGLLAYGLYGLQSVQADGVVIDAADTGAGRPALLEAIAAARLSAPGALVEDKGAIVSLHWRSRPSDEVALRRIAERAAASGAVEVREGRQLVELALLTGPDKGAVVRLLCGGLHAACAIGDDVGDLAAFDALDALGHDGVDAIKVAVSSDEAPEDLLGRADLVLHGPRDVADFLAELAGAARGGPIRGTGPAGG